MTNTVIREDFREILRLVRPGARVLDVGCGEGALLDLLAHDSLRPYFCLIGQSRRRALSRLPLSGQLLSGAKRWAPVPAPPRPSCTR